MKILLFGLPGSGKTTQAELLAKRLGFKHIYPGQMFRDEIANKTPLGLEIKEVMESGHFVENSITNKLMFKSMNEYENIIFDGYPRNIPQAEWYVNHMSEDDLFIMLELNEQIIINRLLNRGRQGDTLDIIQERINVYKKETLPAIQYYNKYMHYINGDDKINDVYSEIMHLIG